MTIAAGDKIPSAELKTMTADGPSAVSTDDLFAGKKVVLFGLPGAFTGTCHNKHVPGFVSLEEEIKAKGVDTIALVSVNDMFVMGGWKEVAAADSDIQFLSDWDAAFTKAIGMDIDLSVATLGVRSKRYAMIVNDGVVELMNIEDSPGETTVSSAASVLAAL